MSTFRRQTSKGMTKFYHYKFYVSGKFYTGVCTGCETKTEADKYEKSERDRVSISLSASKGFKSASRIADHAVKTYLGDSSVEKFKIEEAFDAAMSRSNRGSAEETIRRKKIYWNDFASFMADRHPGTKYLHLVEASHATEYMTLLKTHGRHGKPGPLSGIMADRLRKYLHEVFTTLFPAGGPYASPFARLGMKHVRHESRQAFTMEQVELLLNETNDFCRPLFRIGLATAMRLGDVCLLRWGDVNFQQGTIRKKQRKTGEPVEIPMLQPIYDFLLELKSKNGTCEYVLPEQAVAYQKNRVQARLKWCFSKLGIITCDDVKGRSRCVNRLGFHALRHTFAYMAGIWGLSRPVVQSILGHMSPEMTKLYESHASIEDKRREMQKLPSAMFGGESLQLTGGDMIQKIKSILSSGNLTEREKKILEIVEGKQHE